LPLDEIGSDTEYTLPLWRDECVAVR
jgi:hypothetical protein